MNPSSGTVTTRRGSTEVRVDLYRDKAGKWRWRLRSPGHVLADSGQGYSRRIDCLQAAMRTTGVTHIAWLGEDRTYDYGQAFRNGATSFVSFFVWHKSEGPR